jgi:phage repressor protein C with HTH and peptisase S24 domain
MALGLNILNARKLRNMTPQQFANAAGIDLQALRALEKRDSKTSQFTEQIARALELTTDQLLSGDIAIRTGQYEENVTEAPALRSAMRIPVVGHIRGGDDGYLEELEYPAGYGDGHIEYWTKDPQAFALRIKGDSMHPRYRAGEYAVVTPGIEASPGMDVAVKLTNGKKLLKQLNWVRGDEIQLLSINNGYAPMTIPMNEIESIHRVAGSVPADAFHP